MSNEGCLCGMNGTDPDRCLHPGWVHATSYDDMVKAIRLSEEVKTILGEQVTAIRYDPKRSHANGQIIANIINARGHNEERHITDSRPFWGHIMYKEISDPPTEEDLIEVLVSIRTAVERLGP